MSRLLNGGPGFGVFWLIFFTTLFTFWYWLHVNARYHHDRMVADWWREVAPDQFPILIEHKLFKDGWWAEE